MRELRDLKIGFYVVGLLFHGRFNNEINEKYVCLPCIFSIFYIVKLFKQYKNDSKQNY